jgi:FkbM family methyltransferase
MPLSWTGAVRLLFLFLRKSLVGIGRRMISISERIPCVAAEVITSYENWVTCRFRNTIWMLDKTQYIDTEILTKGTFEPHTTAWVLQLVKEGMVAVDVGANFGYYTIMLSRLVGETGQVLAFEPCRVFRRRLKYHIERNRCRNVSVFECGLSDSSRNLHLLGIGDSATLKWFDDRRRPQFSQPISVKPFDSLTSELRITRCDFIKVDIDGHEPLFLSGAKSSLESFRPIMVMEFSQLALQENGSDVETLARQLDQLGYTLYSEHGRKPLANRTELLIETKNCAYSVNVFCFPREKAFSV